MTRETWTIRTIEEGDLELVRSLYRVVKQRNRPSGYDRWRFAENPFSRCRSVIAIDRGVCIGLQALWPLELRLGSETVLGGQLLDAMTDPAYRRRGVFSTLAEESCRLAAAAGLEALYGFPNRNSHPIFVQRLDWDDVGGVPLWRRSLGPLTERVRRREEWPALWRELRTGAPPAVDLRFSAGDQFPEGFDALLEEWSALPGLCRVNRSPAWYRWRYAAASEHLCEWVGAHRGGRLAACGLWGTYTGAWGAASAGAAVLFDLLGSDAAALSAVAAGCVARARGRGCRSLTALTNDPGAIPVLRDAGFLAAETLPLIVRKLTTRTLGGNVHHFPAWRVMTGDIDIF